MSAAAAQSTSQTAPAKRVIHTDVSRPARLPTGRLGLGNLRAAGERKGETGRGNDGGAGHAVPSQQHLDVLAENANKMIDDEISALLEGFKTIVQLGTVADKDEFRISQDSLQMQNRADGMVRAAQNLLLLSKALSLSLILSKTPSSEAMRDQANALIEQTQEHKKECANLLQGLIDSFSVVSCRASEGAALEESRADQAMDGS